MKFDWEAAIETNFEALERIVLVLYALAGIASHRPVVATLPRHLRIRILSILRPAEYAARRLVAIAACRLRISAPPERRSGGAARNAEPAGGEGTPPAGSRAPAFQLFDPFKPFPEPWLTPEEIAALDDPDGAPGLLAPPLPPGDPIDARAVCRRIVALRNAMADLDGQARRLARWQARRHRDTCRPKRWSPMRPGRPPGWRKRPKTALQEVLHECHLLACDAWRSFDTS